MTGWTWFQTKDGSQRGLATVRQAHSKGWGGRHLHNSHEYKRSETKPGQVVRQQYRNLT
jgi:hypothetical protein